MKNLVLTLLARDEAGLMIALAIAAAGAFLVVFGGPGFVWTAPIGWLLLAAGAVLGAGAVRHLILVKAAEDRNPAPGRMVLLGGHRIHVFAEGDSNGRPAVVWFPGAHAASFELHHLHRQLRDDTRSILIDRPGTGWSDAGPFPRTTAREADEMVAALRGAGEPGPFVWVGHSFGGLLAANIARRYPELTAAVVLLDATPLDVITYGPRLGELKAMKRDSLIGAVRRLFGLHTDIAERRAKANPAYAAIIEAIDRQLGPDGLRARALNIRSRGGCAGASIYSELAPGGLTQTAWQTVVYDKDLDGQRVLVVAPGDSPEVRDLAEVAQAGARDADRMARFFPLTRERYMATSDLAERVVTPPGTGHNFPFQVPDFTADVVRSALGVDPRRAPKMAGA